MSSKEPIGRVRKRAIRDKRLADEEEARVLVDSVFEAMQSNKADKKAKKEKEKKEKKKDKEKEKEKSKKETKKGKK